MTEFELTEIDRHFAAFILREAADPPPWLGIAASLASSAVGSGNICLDMADLAAARVLVDGEEVVLPPLEELRHALMGSGVVGPPGLFRPLVLDDEGRLYLYRYWRYEENLARVILAKALSPCGEIDGALLSAGLARLFPGCCGEGTDWQKVAALAALAKRFSVISGGPGTGKTSTVVKIIALLIEQAKGKGVRIALAAPTGKSAARLNESIRLMKEGLDCAATVKEQIPAEVSTIHRLLGSMGGAAGFRYSAENPLPFDAVIIDEASMVALPLMARLAVAMRGEARLILLGDRDQLASVEAGAVLGDICGGGRSEPFSEGFAELVGGVCGERLPLEPSQAPLPPLCDSLVVLKRNYRFAADSGIGAVGRAVNAGDGEGAIALLKGEMSSDIAWRGLPGPDGLRQALSGAVVAGYGPYLGAKTAEEALEMFDAFRVLSALRQGPYGVFAVNAVVEDILGQKGLIDLNGRWYRGRPVMITVNDYNLSLFNGDVGIVFPDPEAGGNPRVFFPAPGGGVRGISPVRLPPHETVYAMTIHKSQGSEFDRVLMLLPPRDSELLTRELIYTGITRARGGAEIWGDESVFVAAVKRRIERRSGLKRALWNETRGLP